MLTIETIKKNFTFIKAIDENTECYHETEQFPEHGKFCDIYFMSIQKELTQKQVDIFNDFKNNFKQYIPRIEQEIPNILKPSELNRLEEIKKSTLLFDVIEIPQNKSEYDLLLVCGKTFKKLLFIKVNIDLHVEFKGKEIALVKRKKYYRLY
jgi:hypothetical protein